MEKELAKKFASMLTPEIMEEVRQEMRSFRTAWFSWGQFDAYWISFYLFLDNEVKKIYNEEERTMLDQWAELAKSAGWIATYEGVAFVCDRPDVINVDEESRFHSEEAPGFMYPDGFGIYAIHGVVIDPGVILEPERITYSDITSEDNVEVRRILIERMGYDRFIQDADAELVDESPSGKLYRITQEDDEDITLVSVVNSTPEPDGTYKDYFLRVPPEMTTAKEAVAWTFDMTEEEYAPYAET